MLLFLECIIWMQQLTNTEEVPKRKITMCKKYLIDTNLLYDLSGINDTSSSIDCESTLNFYKENGFEIDTKHSFLKKL